MRKYTLEYHGAYKKLKLLNSYCKNCSQIVRVHDIYIYIYVCVCVCVCVCVFVWVCVCVWGCVYVIVFISVYNTHTHTHTHTYIYIYIYTRVLQNISWIIMNIFIYAYWYFLHIYIKKYVYRSTSANTVCVSANDFVCVCVCVCVYVCLRACVSVFKMAINGHIITSSKKRKWLSRRRLEYRLTHAHNIVCVFQRHLRMCVLVFTRLSYMRTYVCVKGLVKNGPCKAFALTISGRVRSAKGQEMKMLKWQYLKTSQTNLSRVDEDHAFFHDSRQRSTRYCTRRTSSTSAVFYSSYFFV